MKITEKTNFPSFKGELTFQDILISCPIRIQNFKTWCSYVSLIAQIPTRLDTVPFHFNSFDVFFFRKKLAKNSVVCVPPPCLRNPGPCPMRTHLEVVWGRQVWVRRREVRAPRP